MKWAVPAALFLTITTGFAQVAPSGPTRISGVVTTTDQPPVPLGGAIVTISGAEFGRARSVVTDSAGAFSFTGLPPSRFTVTATKHPYLPMSHGATRPGRPGTPLTIAAGQHVSDVALRLSRGGVITGVLRDARGMPFPDVPVSLIALQVTATAGPARSSAITDDRGMYRIFGVMPGSYLVAATPVVAGIGDVAIPASAEIDRIFAEAQRPIQQTVRSSMSAPPSVPAFGFAPVFYPGTVNVVDAQAIVLSAGDVRSADFVIAPARAGIVEGTVQMSDGSALPRVQLALDPYGPPLPFEFGQGPVLSVRPGADPRFRFTNVTPGRYRLSAGMPTPSLRSPGTPEGVWWAETEIISTGEDITNIALTIQPGLRVTGRVVFDGVGAAPNPTTVRLQFVSARPSTRAVGMSSPTVFRTTARADGSFDVSVEPGSYWIFADAIGAWAMRSAMFDGLDAQDLLLKVDRERATSNGILTFSDRRSELSGTLQTERSQPATDYFVLVMPVDRALWRPGARRIQSTRPATDGFFAIRDLPAGEYFLAALTDLAPEDLADPQFLAQVASASIRIQIADGQKVRQDLRITR